MLNINEVINDAENGIPEAQNLLASLYLEGDTELGVEQDIQNAVKWFEKSVEVGNIAAMGRLGEIYCTGEYGISNTKRGILLLEKAADAGDNVAMGNLGFVYSKGVGVLVDREKGFQYFLMSAENGNIAAMHIVAGLYGAGDGVEKDEEQQVFWLYQEEIHRKFEASFDKIEELSKEGNAAIEEDDLDYALECFENALELIPDPKEIFSAATWLYAGMGEVYFLSYDYEQSLEVFQKALQSCGGEENPYISYMLGASYYELGQTDTAKTYLQKAYDMAGEHIFKGDGEKYLKLVIIK